METNINKPKIITDRTESELGLVKLTRRVPVYDHFPLQAGDEPAAFINLPEANPIESAGFIVAGNAFEPFYYDGNIIMVNDRMPPQNGSEVICEVDGRMELARLHGELLTSPLQGRHFEIPLSQARHVLLVVGNLIGCENANFPHRLD